jgi:ComF family protein
MLPQRCLLCTAAAPGQALCDGCLAQLPRLAAAHCRQCALPNPHGETCGACLADPPAFARVSAAYSYAWPLAPLIRQFKYAGNLALTGLLADALCSAIGEPVDLVIPMPLGPLRLRERGFNQALELARHAAAATGTRLAANACRRVIDNAPQATLPWRQRAKNIRGAFVCDMDLTGLRVAVVDDVITTGATLQELARTLHKAGAREVHGWMVARTLKHTQ